MKRYAIYRILCASTGKSYIGLTSDLGKRKYAHFYSLRKGTHKNPKLQTDYNEYGNAVFTFEVIEIDVHEDYISGREIYWINHFNSLMNGYNGKSGGIGYSGEEFLRVVEERRKLSRQRKMTRRINDPQQ